MRIIHTYITYIIIHTYIIRIMYTYMHTYIFVFCICFRTCVKILNHTFFNKLFFPRVIYHLHLITVILFRFIRYSQQLNSNNNLMYQISNQKNCCLFVINYCSTYVQKLKLINTRLKLLCFNLINGRGFQESKLSHQIIN